MFGNLDYLKVKMMVFHYHVEYFFTYMELTLSQVHNKKNIYGHFSPHQKILRMNCQ